MPDKSDGLRFGFEAGSIDRLFVDVRADVAERFFGAATTATEALARLATKKSGLIEMYPIWNGFGVRMYVNYESIASTHSHGERTIALLGLGTVLNGLQQDARDPAMHAEWAYIPDEQGHFKPSFGFKWPKNVDDVSLLMATAQSVDDVTRRIGYISPDGAIEKSTGVTVNREMGIYMWLGDSHISTNVSRYHSAMDWVDLSPYSITDQRQQLIALAGTVALAHPEDLLANQ